MITKPDTEPSSPVKRVEARSGVPPQGGPRRDPVEQVDQAEQLHQAQVVDHVAGAITRIRDITESVFETLREVRDATADCVRRRTPSSSKRSSVRQVGTAVGPESGPERGAEGERRPVVADLAGLRPLLWSRLTGGHLGALIAGIGFIAAPGLLADAAWYLEWWQENPAGAPVQLLRDLDPSSSAFYDYTHWDWFTGPHSGAERTICGPYVDYLCTDEYSLTLSTPVVVGGAFVGVAAADVFVRRFEGAVIPALREIPSPAFLTNAQGRVVASTTARWVAGSVYRGADGFAVRPVPGLPLSLVAAVESVAVRGVVV